MSDSIFPNETVGRAQGEYVYDSVKPSHTQAYLWLHVFAELDKVFQGLAAPRRVFDLGCGNGALMNALASRGYDVTGVDPSESGVSLAKAAWPDLPVFVGSAYDALSDRYGTFPAVVSLEVVEHLYSPRHYAQTMFKLVEPGGCAIVSTPYHGYVKNLALALSGKLESHFTALWDHGHIKFWSIRTLTVLLRGAGFGDIRFIRAGRIPALAKSMIAVARRPCHKS
jgi:2-polyprenyl-6-hydroxyphenyl methylase/3-demethylubiquinone-9 3-methyltransferase